MISHRLLVADDDPLILAATTSLLTSHGYLVDVARSGQEAVEKCRMADVPYSLILLDYHLGDRKGSSVATEILKLQPRSYILIHSGDSSREALKVSWGAGAVGFIEKGEDAEDFLRTVASWCRKYEETYLTVSLARSISGHESLIAQLNMVGRSQAMADIAAKVARYSAKSENVLILGETGTGKERVARSLHKQDASQFFPVNCASYNGQLELMESDLFGYVKGAFTGAQKDHVGVFEAAKHGTVFLDEVHTLDLRAQQKLLRVIQEKTVRPVGSNREYKLTFRLVAAAKMELEAMVESGQFLPDLYERLNVLKIEVPPLRERPEDIEPLVAYFCEQYMKESGEERSFLSRTVKYFEKYSWPRNVRELENCVRRLCVDTNASVITPEHLDVRFFGQAKETPGSDWRERKTEVLRPQIESALKGSRSQREAARRLGMPESTLRRLVKQLGLASIND